MEVQGGIRGSHLSVTKPEPKPEPKPDPTHASLNLRLNLSMSLIRSLDNCTYDLAMAHGEAYAYRMAYTPPTYMAHGEAAP